jgi:hypothetical protein
LKTLPFDGGSPLAGFTPHAKIMELDCANEVSSRCLVQVKIRQVNFATRGCNFPETPKRDASQEGLWGQIDTELAAGGPPRGSGRHLGQQGRVPKEELLAHSAAVPLKGAFFAAQLVVSVVRPVSSSLPMQVCFVGGLGSPCSQAGHLACKAPVSKRMLGTSGEQVRSHVKASGSELESCKF